jgi:DNA-binding transcriptional LysR family regulator
VRLTEAGVALHSPVRDALERIEHAAARRQHQRRGCRLAIPVLPTFSVGWLMSRLLGFAEHDPNIEVPLVNAISPENCDREDIHPGIGV